MLGVYRKPIPGPLVNGHPESPLFRAICRHPKQRALVVLGENHGFVQMFAENQSILKHPKAKIGRV